MKVRYLDANILLRHLAGDHPIQSPKATALIQRLERGQEQLETSPLVLFETIFTLQRHYKVERRTICSALTQILRFRALGVPSNHLGKHHNLRALELYVSHNADFTDAYNVAAMEARGIKEIYSFDTDFDDFANVKRIEPGKQRQT